MNALAYVGRTRRSRTQQVTIDSCRLLNCVSTDKESLRAVATYSCSQIVNAKICGNHPEKRVFHYLEGTDSQKY